MHRLRNNQGTAAGRLPSGEIIAGHVPHVFPLAPISSLVQLGFFHDWETHDEGDISSVPSPPLTSLPSLLFGLRVLLLGPSQPEHVDTEDIMAHSQACQ